MKKILLLLLITPLLILTANANIRIYDTMESFEKAEGEICEAATDGCNNFFMSDGKVGGGTRMFCQDHTPAWTCTKIKEGTMTIMTTSMNAEPTLYDDQAETTLVGGDKDEHGCIGSAGYKWNESVEECLRPWEKIVLGKNDESFYKKIQDTLDEKYQEKVEKTFSEYKEKIKKYDLEKREKLNKAITSKLETTIDLFLLKFPMDSKLSQKDNDIYFILSLFKFELMKLNLDY